MTDVTLSKTDLNKSETALLLKAAQHEAGLIVFPASVKPGPWERLIGRFLRDGLIGWLEDGTGHRLLPAGYRAVGVPPPRAGRKPGLSAAPVAVAAAHDDATSSDAAPPDTYAPEAAQEPEATAGINDAVGADPVEADAGDAGRADGGEVRDGVDASVSPDPADSPHPAARRPRGKQGMILDLLARPEGASLTELNAATGWLPHTTRAALSRLRSGGTVLLKGRRGDGVTAYRVAPDQSIGSAAKGKAAPDASGEPAKAGSEPVSKGSGEVVPEATVCRELGIVSEGDGTTALQNASATASDGDPATGEDVAAADVA